MATALITGASGVIGLELARIFAANGNNVVLVARNQSRLGEIKAELEAKHKVKVLTIDKDLSLRDAAREVYEQTQSSGWQIDYLVNNAGFGDYGPFADSSWDKQLQMIDLNITALTHLTKLYLENMMARKSGKIMNLASTAAFQSGPLMAVYFATKSYVLHFSEALDNEVREKGITLTAVCPGATESGFQAAAAMEESGLVKNKKLPTSHEVATFAYESMMKGKTVAIHGLMNKILANSVRWMPRSVVVKITRKMQEKA